MPIVKSCCGACNLLRGGKVLSWTEIVLNVISIVFTGIVLGKDDEFYINTQRENIIRQQKIELVKEPHKKLDPFDRDEYATYIHMIRVTLFVYVILKVVVIVASVILYIAVVKRKRLLIVPYLMVAMLNILFFIYANIRMIVLIDELGEFMFWVVLTVALGMAVYFWICMLSLYQEMKEHENIPTNPTLLQPLHQENAQSVSGNNTQP